ncbi:MAG: cytochrome C oxidase subunit IV family protein [Crocinitomicaceae bacterium]|nr:cytochrome C oxidase subunit IV family protein [Crocinitomicaceae bacterium]
MIRDDVYEYSLDGHHSEEEGVKIRKKIWFVTFLLSVITIVEVATGIFFPKASVSEGAWIAIKYGYIILTIIKAGYIVMVFMHLGDEKKALKSMILVPYILFILYLIFICIMEATHVNEAWTNLH